MSVSQTQDQTQGNERRECSLSSVLSQHTPAVRLAQQQRAEKLRTDPDVGYVHEDQVFCRVCETWLALSKKYKYERRNWDRHRNSRRHVLRAAEQGKQRLQLRASPQLDAPHSAHLTVLPNDRQNPNSEDDNHSNASSPSLRYTPLLNFPAPESLPSPTDPYTTGSSTLSVLNAPNISDIFNRDAFSTADPTHRTADDPITRRPELQARKPTISSIRNFIRSKLSPSPPYTSEELTITAHVIYDLAERGAMEIGACVSD